MKEFQLGSSFYVKKPLPKIKNTIVDLYISTQNAISAMLFHQRYLEPNFRIVPLLFQMPEKVTRQILKFLSSVLLK